MITIYEPSSPIYLPDDEPPVLICSEIPELLPMTGRSDGVHISTLISSLCVEMGFYKSADFRDAPKSKMALGSALEHALAHRYMLQYPGKYYRWWDPVTESWRNDLEVERDGVYGTIDLFDVQTPAVEEIKLTWMSTRQEFDEQGKNIVFSERVGKSKLWRFGVQLKAYLWMIGAEAGRLHLAFPRGDYKSEDADYHVWEKRFSERSLENNWGMLMRQRDKITKETA